MLDQRREPKGSNPRGQAWTSDTPTSPHVPLQAVPEKHSYPDGTDLFRAAAPSATRRSGTPGANPRQTAV